ncbi:stage II sporulation protein R [Oceanobacillus piezotolerans]|uniref:Stage II sporulation protein R n=1 Tax=Oceanobacillus piezotolerans TaxID=2448030 RepID=A0A498DKE0_9BACI|nr:stage II sporulation protein R [Oceanobacillus piezotolerans]RLL42895.1 stage II sporulation protein R [Oceanobacillus piezotolerans]
MKKFVFFVLILFILFLSIPNKGISGEEKGLEYQYQEIPDEAIRLRILANSDTDRDQEIKRLVRDEVNKEVATWVEDMTNLEEARKVIETRIPEIKEIVADVLEAEGTEVEYTVEYGENVTFPTKLYGTHIYPAGEYEAILITLGEGQGDNWWCVLFPPLCFLDFSFGTSVAAADAEENPEEIAEAEQEEETEVKFFLFEWFGWS